VTEAGFEIPVRGWAPVRWETVALHATVLTPGILIALTGFQPPLAFTVPIVVPFLVLNAGIEVWRTAEYRSTRYVIGPDDVVAKRGVLREKVRWRLAKSDLRFIEVRDGEAALCHDGGVLLLEGAGLEGVDAISRAWLRPHVGESGEIPHPERDAWRARGLGFTILFLAIVAQLLGLNVRRMEASFAARRGRISTCWTAAEAATLAQLSRPGSLSMKLGGGSSYFGGFRPIQGERETWTTKLGVAPCDASGQRTGNFTSVVGAVARTHFDAGFFSKPSPVEIYLLDESEDALFLGELEKQLDAAGIPHVLEKP
jgi:hypothetical protein